MVGLLVLFWAGAGGAYGQVSPDTGHVDAPPEAGVAPPAPLDSVRAEDAAPPDTSAPEKAVVTADSLSAMVRRGERLQELFENVWVRQDTTRLRSNYGLRYLNRDELLFTGDVVIYERGDTLRADTVWYNKRTQVGRARSNVRLTDGEVVVHAPRATYFTEEKRAVFPDSVTLVDSSRVLRAREGTYWSDVRRAEFSGNVHLTDPETHLEADSLTYFRDDERSIATGSVFIRRIGEDEDVEADTASITYLFGEWADNQEQNRYSRVERRALLVRVRMDSTGAPDDTLAVRAHRLEAQRTDTHHRLVAVDSVRIWQADLAAVADSAVYDRVVGVGNPDTTNAPSPRPDTTTAPGADTTHRFHSPLDSLVAQVRPVGVDSLLLGAALAPKAPTPPLPDTTHRDTVPSRSPTNGPVAGERTRETPRPRRPAQPPDSVAADTGQTDRVEPAQPRTRRRWTTPSVASEDELPLEETRLFRKPITWFERSQVWGDSIRVRARKRSLDTVYVRGGAFAAQRDTTVDRIRQLKGKNITAFFRRDSLRRIIARPNGQAIHFSASEQGTLNGATRASADFVELHFRHGDVDRIKFGRGIQGEAYHKKEYIPDPFRLQGFQWTPERRPTRARLLQEERVRERLNLTPLEPGPERRPPPVARVSADSVAQRSGAVPRESGSQSPRSSIPPAVREEIEERRSIPPDSLAVPGDSLSAIPSRRSVSPPSDSTETPNSKP